MGRQKENGITWCDFTFNPWWGCTKISPACTNCYAATFAKRVGWNIWGGESDRRFFDDAHFNEPIRWNKRAEFEGRRLRVFCGSMCDVFEDRDELLSQRLYLFDVIRRTPNLDWLLLTKRPENIIKLSLATLHIQEANFAKWDFTTDWISRWFSTGVDFLPHNVWLGTTVENQEYADKRIPALISAAARVHFLSCEPLLGAIDLKQYLNAPDCIDWVIVGGESGLSARPSHPDWFRSLRDQCANAGVPFHFKQLGEYGTSWRKGFSEDGEPVFKMFTNFQQWVNHAQSWINGGTCIDMTGKIMKCGSDMENAQYPVAILKRLGKKKAGRLLDGVEHNEFPEAQL